MKKILVSIVLTSSILTLSQATQAARYNLFETFQDGQTISATFNGTANGNVISNLSNAQVKFNDFTFPTDSSGSLYIASMQQSVWTATGAQVSFDGLQNNFLFINTNYTAGDNSYTAFYDDISYEIQTGYGTGNVAAWVQSPYAFIDGSISPITSYSVTENNIPEPASIALVGLGFAGLYYSRNNSKK